MKRIVQPPKSGKKEIGKGKIPFFKSLKSVLRSVKVIFRMDWRNIPAFVINQFLVTLQPFVALFFFGPDPGYSLCRSREANGGELDPCRCILQLRRLSS